MAIVRTLEELSLEKQPEHSEAQGTYSIIETSNGKFLQIDTYGSPQRQLKGKKSQSIRFSLTAIDQLRRLIDLHFKE